VQEPDSAGFDRGRRRSVARKGCTVETKIDEIAEGIYRLSTFVPEIAAPAGFTFNQFLVLGEEPLLFHTGLRRMFPHIRMALSRIVTPERLRWITFGHYEADECGAMNEWLAIAPRSQVAHGQTACLVSLNDSDIDHTHHTKAAVGALAALATGDPARQTLGRVTRFPRKCPLCSIIGGFPRPAFLDLSETAISHSARMLPCFLPFVPHLLSPVCGNFITGESEYGRHWRGRTCSDPKLRAQYNCSIITPSWLKVSKWTLFRTRMDTC
jgi:hypothetical protein